MFSWLTEFNWGQVWASISVILGILIGGVITYLTTDRQVKANIDIAQKEHRHQTEFEWRKIQYEAFRNIQRNLWRVAMFAAQAKFAADDVLKKEDPVTEEVIRELSRTTQDWQEKSREVLHQLEINTAILGDLSMRVQLDELRLIGANLTSAFADPDDFDEIHEKFTMYYDRFRHTAADNVLTIWLAPLGLHDDT